jgi:endonuclease/exonuclease/phosphatase (EEP) superfamily protein YafD
MFDFLELLTLAGLLAGATLTVLGLFAGWRPILDLFNQGRALILVGSVAVVLLALLSGTMWLIGAAIVVMIVNAALFAQGLSGRAHSAAPGSERLLRLVTLNVWKRNPHIEDVAAFLETVDADIVILQEVTVERRAPLKDLAKARYPHILGESGIIILSKHPIGASGQVDGARIDGWARIPLVLWARLEIAGFPFEIAGVHLAYPFNPLDQAADTEALIAFVNGRKAPLLAAGDYNLTPWTWKLRRFSSKTGLMRYNTLRPTWPTLQKFPLFPLIPLDHVFSTQEFVRLSVATASGTGSDHLALIVDITLTKPHSPGNEQNQ